MPRRARTYARYAMYATHTAVAVALVGALSACTGSSGSDGEDDGKPGSASASASVAPGKYRTLPEPCGTVNRGTLKDMLPGAGATPSDGTDGEGPDEGSSADPYKGEAGVTYDTDRKVGCRWKSATTLGTRHLHIDFERVVSYDPAVSDDEQAEQLYATKAEKARIPAGSAPGEESDEADTGESEDAPEDGKTPDGKASPHKEPSDDGTPKATPSDKKSSDKKPSDSASPGQDDDLAPRTLDNIGDSAYINDKLDTGDSGLHRDITLVFRTANVIATVEYDQWVTDKHRIPESRELQDKARKLAEQLAAKFDEEE